MDDDLPLGPGSARVAEVLRRAIASARRREDAELATGWALLAATWADEEELRYAAAAGRPDPSAPPTLRLLPIPASSTALGGLVCLQGLRDDLYVRTQGPVEPAALRLVTDGGAAHAVRLPAGARVFALSLLNGGGHAGVLWHVPDLGADHVLGPLRPALSLDVRTAPDRGWEGAGSVTPGGSQLPWPDPAAPRWIADVIRAYTDGDPATFAPALDRALVDARGDGTRAAPGRTWWRRLTRWEALWLRALVAELEARRDGPRFGCARARSHPQLGRDG